MPSHTLVLKADPDVPLGTQMVTIGVEGSLADDRPTAQYPAVFVFQDTAFGTFLFQDRDAPAAP